MLDIQLKWLLILSVNFLVLIFLLNKILYQPLLKIFRERKETIDGSLAAAQEMNRRKDEGMERMTSEISAARRLSQETFEKFRAEGLEIQKKAFTEAEAAAAEMLQKARAEIRTDAEKARQQLKADVDKFSDEIVRKLVHT